MTSLQALRRSCAGCGIALEYHDVPGKRHVAPEEDRLQMNAYSRRFFSDRRSRIAQRATRSALVRVRLRRSG